MAVLETVGPGMVQEMAEAMGMVLATAAPAMEMGDPATVAPVMAEVMVLDTADLATGVLDMAEAMVDLAMVDLATVGRGMVGPDMAADIILLRTIRLLCTTWIAEKSLAIYRTCNAI